MALRAAVVAAAAALAGWSADPNLPARVKQITRTSLWVRAGAIAVSFPTHHPQGMVKIGDTFFVSSVDKAKATGHLFKIDGRGALLADATLGEGAMYHPGGLDYDGKYIWVPVAEYRPDSRAIVYRVDPATLKAEEVFRFADHVGAIVHDTDDHALYGVSWGSRRFYRWALDAKGQVADPGVPSTRGRLNPSHYVDYQDCKYAGLRQMICTGVTEIRQTPESAPFRLGGIELVDLAAGRPVHQSPILLWTPGGAAMTQNPSWIETTASGLRAYFMPEDDKSTIYLYDLKSISSP